MKILSAIVLALLLAAPQAYAQQGQAVDLPGGRSLLMRPKAPQASLILMPGGAGSIGVTSDGTLTRLRGNSLVRTADAFLKRNLAVLIVDADTDLRAAVDYMAAIKRPVIVAGTSRGTLRAAEGIARGARPDRLVLTSGFLSAESGNPRQNVMAILGSPDRLPPTLVVHHRQDACRLTLPAGVDPFVKWAGGRARVTWIDGGTSEGDPCEAFAHHGFNGVEGRMVAAVAGFR
ncbi:MAG: putative exported protein of unknown function [Hyphomicrobiales bacterium]|nr:putative exported protein of unknown function [Hyphomicrobiales bacterium]